MSKFGWHYPPGAANDPMAPYNQPDPECPDCHNIIMEKDDHEDDCPMREEVPDDPR